MLMQKITVHMKREGYCKNKHPEMYIAVMNHPGDTYIERLYNYCNNDPSHQCICGKLTKFINFNKGYSKYCSPGCASKDPKVKEAKVQTVLSHYGVSNPSQSNIVRDKVKNTMLDRYGDVRYNNREQAKKTCLEKYGENNAMQSENIKEKLKQTCMERYGVEYTFSLPEVIRKSTNTCNKKYGGRGNASPELLSRMRDTCTTRYNDANYNNRMQAKETCLERYGEEHYNNREQAKETCLKRYNVEYASQSPEIKDLIKSTTKERYGSDCIFRTDEFKKQSKETCLKKYGVEYASQDQKIKDKIKETCLKKYGVEYASQSDEVKNKVRNKLNSKLKSQFPNLIECYYDDGEKYYKMSCGDCDKCEQKYFNIRAIDASRRKSYKLELCPILNPFSTVSNTSIEKFVKDILDEYGVYYICNDRNILQGKELDIYIPEHKLAIECNGVYWHSDKYHEHKYHYNKYTRCKSQGIQLITIWSDQIYTYPDKIKSLILSKLHIYDRVIYARKCEWKYIDSKTCKKFLDDIHLQNNTNSSYRIGLYYKDELLSVMTFGKSRNCMSGGNDWELYRYAVKPGTIIIGGASKLLSKFINDNKPSNIISFSSNDISNGDLYEKLGFKYAGDTVGYWYVKDNIRYHRYTFSKHKLVSMGCDKNKSEFEIMNELNYDRIYDSGQTKWVYSEI